MAKIRGLQQRGRTYYSRIVVPKALVPHFGRSEILKSLRTTHRSEAEALHLEHGAQWAAAFAEVELNPHSQGDATSSGCHLDNDEVAALARRFFLRRMTDLESRARGPADAEAEKAAATQDLQWELSSLQSWDNPEASRLVEEAKQEALREIGGEGQIDGRAADLLAELIRRALVQLGATELAQLQGDYRDRIEDRFFRNGEGSRPSAPSHSTGPNFGKCIERYQAEVLDLRPVTGKTRLKHKALLAQIADHFGTDARLEAITRADCNHFRDVLAKLPPNFGKRAGNRSIAKIADANRSGKTLAWETQNSYLKMLSDLLGWAKRERLVHDNVAEQISPLRARQPAESQRLPFSDEELQSLFALPLFTGSVDDERSFKRVGPNLVRRSRYWAPLLGLFTGMRMGEIVQLTPEHVRVSPAGTPFIVLTRDMKLKTGNAEREVPIHPQLIELGFLDWVEERRKAGAKILFADVPESKHGYASDVFSKRFATVLKAVDLPRRRCAASGDPTLC